MCSGHVQHQSLPLVMVTVTLSSMLEILPWLTARVVIVKVLNVTYLTLIVQLYRY
jgi:hypothetical protein